MEDAATAEIARSQIWQWIRHGVELDDGRSVTRELVREAIAEELEKLRAAVGDKAFDAARPDDARALFEQVALAEELEDFLTLPAYELLEP
jgi:malate synthase